MRLGSDQARAVLRKIRVSPQKLNLVAAAIRGKPVEEARCYLRFCPKRISDEVFKTLNSAIANAENNHGLDPDLLVVREAFVGKSLTLRRFAARGRGRGTAIHKPFSHLTIVVEEINQEEIERVEQEEKAKRKQSRTAKLGSKEVTEGEIETLAVADKAEASQAKADHAEKVQEKEADKVEATESKE